MRYPPRVWLIVLCATILHGCTMRSLVLDNAEWFAFQAVDDFFDVTDQQEAKVKKDIGSGWKWFLENPRKDLLSLFDRAQIDWADGLTEAEVREGFLELRRLRTKIFKTLAPSGGRFLSRLSPPQVIHFEERLKEKASEDAEILEESDEDFKEYLAERAEERIKRFYGSATKDQIKLTLEILGTSKEQERRALEWRRQTQANFLKWLKTQPTEQAATEKLQLWIRQTDLFRPKAIRKAYRRRMDAYQLWWWRIDQTASKAQRNHAINFVREWREVLEAVNVN